MRWIPCDPSWDRVDLAAVGFLHQEDESTYCFYHALLVACNIPNA